MAKFHLPAMGMLYGMDSWKFFVEVIREERRGNSQIEKSFERHFYPSTTDDLAKFRRNFPSVVSGAVDVVIRRIADLEVNNQGVTVLFKDGELVEGLQT